MHVEKHRNSQLHLTVLTTSLPTANPNSRLRNLRNWSRPLSSIRRSFSSGTRVWAQSSPTALLDYESDRCNLGFRKETATGQLDEQRFVGIFTKFFPHGSPDKFARRIFSSFDTDKNGTIDFKEYICALSVTSRGKVDDKLGWAFQLYDKDGDGLISMDEMEEIVQAIYDMVSTVLLGRWAFTINAPSFIYIFLEHSYWC